MENRVVVVLRWMDCGEPDPRTSMFEWFNTKYVVSECVCE